MDLNALFIFFQVSIFPRTIKENNQRQKESSSLNFGIVGEPLPKIKQH
jgi:hypothetical protein